MSMRSFSGCSGQHGSRVRSKIAAYFIAGKHIYAAPEAVVDAAIFGVIAVGSGHGQTELLAIHCISAVRCSLFAGCECRRTESGAGCTHPFDAIVTIAGLR
jgi:hypothetical protein